MGELEFRHFRLHQVCTIDIAQRGQWGLQGASFILLRKLTWDDIRCSGIHRGMGTHISRVKSVDLDSWTDEQLASMVRWGNARANKYV